LKDSFKSICIVSFIFDINQLAFISRSSSSRRDSERYKSSSRSSSHRKDDKYRSKSSLYKKGEDASNLYYFGEEQTLELAKSRGHLDEVMIRLELDTGGYESLISESENEEESTESYSYQLELNRTEALNVRNLLDIDIPGLDEQEEAEHSVDIFFSSPAKFLTVILFRHLCSRKSMPMRS
jgi:hypothetical protein